MSFHQIWYMLLARKWLMLVTLATTVAVAALVTFLLPPRYTANASVVIDFKTQDPVSGNLFPALLLPSYLATQLDIIGSQGVALKAVDRLKLAEQPASIQLFQEQTGGEGSIRHWLADLLLNNLHLDSTRESGMVTVRYRSKDPEFAATAANAIVQAYVDTTVDLRVEPARQSTVFFNDQLRLLKQEVANAQRKLSEFQRKNGITAIDERYDVENARLADLSTQVVTAQAQTADSVSRRKQVADATKRGGPADSLAEVVNNPVVQSLKNALAAAETRFADMAARLGPGHPQYQTAKSEVDELKRNLAAEMDVLARSVNTTSDIATQREGSLKGEMAAQRARVLEIKKQRDESALLMREVENAQRAYDAVMARFTPTRLESQSNQTNVAVINRAIPPTQPSSPKLLLNLALAVLVGGALAVGLALLAERLDRVVRCEQDVFDAVDAPVMGFLPAERRTLPAPPLSDMRGASA